ncbi:MAG: D-alanyl-D-alanine carboxypeptidase, partial [Deltaproteobacteria bacterium]|nr:D-alanyl-D-alanine carboxypeptidase [Deltaproteobacteria bacterium]
MAKPSFWAQLFVGLNFEVRKIRRYSRGFKISPSSIRAKILSLAITSMVIFFFASNTPAQAAGDWQTQVRTLLKGGALVVADQTGKPILSINPDKPMMPASTLKILTSAAAMDYLGPDYRFPTDFRLSTTGDLWVVGRGDPFLVSEEIEIIAQLLKEKGLSKINRLILDNRFFVPNLVLDGTERTLNPYDAYNGALCVNFNTIFVQVGPGRTITSAEPQTPLTDMARELAVKSGSRGQVRLNLADSPQTCLLYAGDLIKTFLQKSGVEVRGGLEPAVTDPGQVLLFHRYASSKTLPWLLTQLLEYSNNFMTN